MTQTILVGGVLPGLLCVIPLVAPSEEHFYWATTGVVWALILGSLNLIWGYAGQFSVAQLALAAIAAYTFTVLQARGWPILLAALAGMAFSMLSSLVLSLVALRLRGFQFAIMTLAFASIVITIVSNWSVTGLANGVAVPLQMLPRTRIFGVSWNLGSVAGGFYALVAVVFVLLNLGIYHVARSAAGRAMYAIRDDEVLAVSLGVSPLNIKVLAFLCSSVVAAIGGILYVLSFQLVIPDIFSFDETLISIMLLVVAGVGSPLAPVVGGCIYVFLYEVVPINGQWREAVLGVVMIVIVLIAPRGLIGLIGKQRQTRGWASRIWGSAKSNAPMVSSTWVEGTDVG